MAADGNGDGAVDDADYDMWKSHFGEVWPGSGSGLGAGAGSISTGVPEPTLLVLICGAAMALFAARAAGR